MSQVISQDLRPWDMSIGKFLSCEAAARKIMERTRAWWEHSGETTLCHTVEACLAIALAVTLWSLVRPWLPIKPARAANRTPIANSSLSQVHRDPRSDIDNLIQAHLFGVAAQTPPVNIVADPAFQISGIAYSSEAGESVAILSLNGSSLVARKGTVLPDGATLMDIEPDRVTISQDGRGESLILDLRKAALNARFTPAQFADGGTRAGTPAGVANISSSSLLSDVAPATAAISAPVTARNPRLEMPHFDSLQQLRGGRKMQRFQKVKPPGI